MLHNFQSTPSSRCSAGASYRPRYPEIRMTLLDNDLVTALTSVMDNIIILHFFVQILSSSRVSQIRSKFA